MAADKKRDFSIEHHWCKFAMVNVFVHAALHKQQFGTLELLILDVLFLSKNSSIDTRLLLLLRTVLLRETDSLDFNTFIGDSLMRTPQFEDANHCSVSQIGL